MVDSKDAGEVPGYSYDADRDRRWRLIVDRYCLLEERNEADTILPCLVAAGVRRVLEVGSHWGPVAERAAPLGIATVCIELDAEVVRLARRPAVRGTAASLPFAAESFDAVTALNVLYLLADPVEAVAEAHRILRIGGLFVACTQARDNDPELRDVAPGWGEPSSFDGDNAEAIVRQVFDDVSVDRWEVPAYRLPTTDAIIDYVEVFCKISRAEAVQRCGALRAPLTITKRGLFVWGRKE
jgi:SAM-dependent methyltransferase